MATQSSPQAPDFSYQPKEPLFRVKVPLEMVFSVLAGPGGLGCVAMRLWISDGISAIRTRCAAVSSGTRWLVNTRRSAGRLLRVFALTGLTVTPYGLSGA